MKMTRSSLTSFAFSGLLSAAISQAAFADDIETLTGQLQDFAGPNVTLVIDTSGSMNSQVFVDSSRAPYDPNVDYTGPFDVYEIDGAIQRLLYTLTPSDSLNFPDEGDVESIQWVRPSVFHCDAGRSVLDSTGFYTGRFAQFSFFEDETGEDASWSFLLPAFDGLEGDSLPTECQADFGVHGDGSGQGNFPINIENAINSTNALFPWTLDETDPRIIEWNETGAQYTFFTPNLLNWVYERKLDDDAVVRTRIEIVQAVAKDLIQRLKTRSIANNDGLRLGLMRFSSDGSGGMVIAPTTDLATSDNTLINEVDDLAASGSTPLAETMYEAYLYHTGSAVEFGLDSEPDESVAAARDGANYKSPIAAACQKNFAVLLTDGQPQSDFEADIQIGNLTGTCSGSCLNEITGHLSTSDLATGFTGDQTLDTFIIGFFTDSPLLESATTGMYDSTPNNGDNTADTPGYFLADDPEELGNALDIIFSSQGINSTVTSFTAPSVSVNSLNRLTNRDTLYFTLYAPSTLGEPHWDGNLKAYKIGRADGSNDIQILDANSNPAVDPATGLFADNAVSLWDTVPDGPNVELGGVAGRLSAQRNIYSNLSSNQSLNNEDDSNLVARSNSAVIGAIPGMPTGDELLELIDFAAGLDSEGGARQTLGDPLHSQPLVINFASGIAGQEDLLLLFGTNDGYFHAIDPLQENDTSNDLELFSFIPKELLPQLATIKADNPSPFPVNNKAYGMDGAVSAWIQNDDGDLIVESGEFLWIYAGMRRGGRSYYAFDLTNRADPKLKFTIDNNSPKFSNLGQTWSEATHATINMGGDDREVLIFGGGYDTNQDDSNTADTIGNSVYIADAISGDLIWSAGDADDTDATLNLEAMTHSIPSDVRVIDINQDGLVDRLYVGDMGGQVWRFDINSNPTGANPAITGGRIADLGGSGTANERRFYSAPSVSRYVEDGSGFLAIGIGSGYRAHPLDDNVDDRFYVLRDDNVFGPALSPGDNPVPEYGDDNATLLTNEAELIPLTLDGIEDGSLAIDIGQFGRGWFLDLNAAAGEKSLSSAVTAEGRIFFTTYSPERPELSCVPTAATGAGRFYGIDILTGLPALYDDVDFAPPIASIELGPTGIPPQPRLVFVAPDCDNCSIDPGDVSDDGLLVLPSTADIVAQVGTQAFNIGLSSRPTRTYWVEF